MARQLPQEVPQADIAQYVSASRCGGAAETARLTELLYGELRGLAAGYLRSEGTGHTLQPTALVHEAFLRMTAQRLEWNDRSHFLALAARTMRRVLVDHARRRLAGKRGNGVSVVVTAPPPDGDDRALDVLALDDALQALAASDSRAAKVVELHFFGGLDVAETAEALGISAATAKRDWTFARAWLRRQLTAGTA